MCPAFRQMQFLSHTENYKWVPKSTSRATRAQNVLMTNMKSTHSLWEVHWKHVAFPIVLQGGSMSCACSIIIFMVLMKKQSPKQPWPSKKKAICKLSWKTVLDFTDSVLASFYLPRVHTWGAVFWNPWRTAPHTDFPSGKKGWVV